CLKRESTGPVGSLEVLLAASLAQTRDYCNCQRRVTNIINLNISVCMIGVKAIDLTKGWKSKGNHNQREVTRIKKEKERGGLIKGGWVWHYGGGIMRICEGSSNPGLKVFSNLGVGTTGTTDPSYYRRGLPGSMEIEVRVSSTKDTSTWNIRCELPLRVASCLCIASGGWGKGGLLWCRPLQSPAGLSKYSADIKDMPPMRMPGRR
ncbi:unnamed protein product, partial [Timema podura]|nr:unnamed protein product [Timema podura]